MLPPPLVWEFPKGTGYASPAVAGQRLVFIHRLGDEEIVECLHPETGSSHWRFRYPTAFEDRYGYNNGPRASPVIDGERVYTIGAEGQAALPRSGDRERWSGSGICARNTRCRRISSGPRRRRWWKAGC